MTEEESKRLGQFEAHVRLLIEKYTLLKQENEELYAMIDEKEKDIKELTQKNAELKQNYDNLKMARMLQISDNEMKSAKQRLSKLVRDVDKCIALLNT